MLVFLMVFSFALSVAGFVFLRRQKAIGRYDRQATARNACLGGEDDLP
ncbi:hypothetical protein ACCD10_22915 [Pseudomonas sp. Pseusp122]